MASLASLRRVYALLPATCLLSLLPAPAIIFLGLHSLQCLNLVYPVSLEFSLFTILILNALIMMRADALLPATCLLSFLPARPAIIASPGKLVALQREGEHSTTHFCQINMQPQQFWSWVTKIKYFEFLLPTILFIMKIYTMILIPAVHFSYSVPKGDRLSHF